MVAKKTKVTKRKATFSPLSLILFLLVLLAAVIFALSQKKNRVPEELNPPIALGVGESNPSASPSAALNVTLKGSDGTWCYDSDGNSNFIKGYCQDGLGTHTDYCESSSVERDWYCTGTWTGTWSNVKCAAGGYVCSAAGKICQDSVCSTVTSTPTKPPSSSSDLISPVVRITSPVNNGRVNKASNVNIRATATDNKKVVKVTFYVDNVLQCTDLTSPYTCAWKVSKQPKDSYTLSARAVDSSGNTGVTNIRVTVKK